MKIQIEWLCNDTVHQPKNPKGVISTNPTCPMRSVTDESEKWLRNGIRFLSNRQIASSKEAEWKKKKKSRLCLYHILDGHVSYNFALNALLIWVKFTQVRPVHVHLADTSWSLHSSWAFVEHTSRVQRLKLGHNYRSSMKVRELNTESNRSESRWSLDWSGVLIYKDF